MGKRIDGYDFIDYGYESVSAFFRPSIFTNTKTLETAGKTHSIPCFCRRLKWSAIMAMNSELVGLPLMPLTV